MNTHQPTIKIQQYFTKLSIIYQYCSTFESYKYDISPLMTLSCTLSRLAGGRAGKRWARSYLQEGESQGVLAATQQRFTLIQRFVVQCNAIDLGPNREPMRPATRKGALPAWQPRLGSGPGSVRCPSLELAREKKTLPRKA